MTTRQSGLNSTATAGFVQRLMSHTTVVRLTRVAEAVPDRLWTNAQDELLATLVAAAPWQAPSAAIAVSLSQCLPAAYGALWAQANVGNWTPLGHGLLLRAAGDGDVDWEEIAAVPTIYLVGRSRLRAVRPRQLTAFRAGRSG
jgi:hypothetical protein